MYKLTNVLETVKFSHKILTRTLSTSAADIFVLNENQGCQILSASYRVRPSKLSCFQTNYRVPAEST